MSLIKMSGVTVTVMEEQIDNATYSDPARFNLEIELNEVQLRSIIDQMLADSRYNKLWDVKLLSGLLAELDFLRMTEAKVEVKHDKEGRDTGNLALEFEYKGEPSGIEATEADLWVHWFDKDRPFLMGKVPQLRALARRYREAHPHKVKDSGDGRHAKCVLMPCQYVLGAGVKPR